MSSDPITNVLILLGIITIAALAFCLAIYAEHKMRGYDRADDYEGEVPALSLEVLDMWSEDDSESNVEYDDMGAENAGTSLLLPPENGRAEWEHSLTATPEDELAAEWASEGVCRVCGADHDQDYRQDTHTLDTFARWEAEQTAYRRRARQQAARIASRYGLETKWAAA